MRRIASRLMCCSVFVRPGFCALSLATVVFGSHFLAAQDQPVKVWPPPVKPAQSESDPDASIPAAQPNSIKVPDVSKEGLVLESASTRFKVEADGTGTRETISRTRVLADSGVKALAVLAFTYTASNQQIEIGYVRVIKPDGTIVTTPDYNIQDMPADVSRTAPMYSDIHQKHIAVKGLGVG